MLALLVILLIMLVVISKGICCFLSLLVGSCLSSHIFTRYEQAVNSNILSFHE